MIAIPDWVWPYVIASGPVVLASVGLYFDHSQESADNREQARWQRFATLRGLSFDATSDTPFVIRGSLGGVEVAITWTERGIGEDRHCVTELAARVTACSSWVQLVRRDPLRARLEALVGLAGAAHGIESVFTVETRPLAIEDLAKPRALAETEPVALLSEAARKPLLESGFEEVTHDGEWLRCAWYGRAFVPAFVDNAVALAVAVGARSQRS